MAIKSTELNNEIVAMRKWLNILNEENRIGIGHLPADEQTPQYRESCGESSELGNQPESEMSGYMEEESAVDEDLYEFTIPEWAAAPLINGDMSGLDDEDEAKIKSFVDNTVARYGNANFSLPDESELDLGFCRSNDIDNLGAKCFKLLLRSEEAKSDIPTKEREAWKNSIDHDLEKYDRVATKNYDDFENGAIYEDGDEVDTTEDEIGDVKISMAIMSHLSDIQQHLGVDGNLNKKLKFVKAMVKLMSDKGDIYITDHELDALHSKLVNN